MLCSFSWRELIEHWQTVTTPNNEMECVKEILPPPTLVSHAFKFYMEYVELLTGYSSLTSFRGLMCIYWMEMVHRDLKSVNCLVDKHLTIKICDFGLSWILTTTPMRDISSAGTPEWMAQELVWNEPFTEKCDIFCLGVLIWELCTLTRPWEGVPSAQVSVRFSYNYMFQSSLKSDFFACYYSGNLCCCQWWIAAGNSWMSLWQTNCRFILVKPWSVKSFIWRALISEYNSFSRLLGRTRRRT